MNSPITDVSRRSLLTGTGALIVSFSLAPSASAQAPAAVPDPTANPLTMKVHGSLSVDPYLDSWIKIDASGSVTIFSGKAELGQGISTALLQVAADELGLPMDRLTLVTADTGRTVNEGYTSGSHSMQDSGTAIRIAAAQMRDLLIASAARQLNVPVCELVVSNGTIATKDGTSVAYGALVGTTDLHVQAQPVSNFREQTALKYMNSSVPRLDIPAKVTGGAAYIQDMRLPGMLHARVVRPPSYKAVLKSLDTAAIEKMPGVVKVVRDGRFLAVVAKREFQAIKAMRALAAAAQWSETASLPDQTNLPAFVQASAAKDYKILDQHKESNPGVTRLEARFTRPYQAHGAIGPSCALAQMDKGVVTVWTHTQGVYPDRAAIAGMLRVPPAQVRCIHVPGSGCYGHNGADDAAGDAALIAVAMPGTPIRLQWMREQEHAWEPFGPAMVTEARAALDSTGKIVDWNYSVWSNTHSMRPGGPGALLAAQHMEKSIAPPPPAPLPLPEGGGDRNALPIYTFPNADVMHHFLPDMPVRVSAMRGLGAYMNVFTIESFMDELAHAAKIDPVAFRLAHLDDPRAIDCVKLAADKFGWDKRAKSANGRGTGFAFARYKNLAAYCAIAMEIEIEAETGAIRILRAVAAVDAGQAVNPDGIRNQIEGAILQSASWTLFENVSFDDTRISSIDWSTYPIMRFNSVPMQVDVHVINRPGTPFLGAGEAGQGPTAAVLANAIADATGQRLRELPLTPAKLKGAFRI